MKTAIITGASSGLGREYALQLTTVFPEIECVWLIARRRDRLEDLRRELKGVDVRILPIDITAPGCYDLLAKLLKVVDPNISLLINCAGCGYLGAFSESDIAEQIGMVELNINGLLSLTRAVLPYMEFKGHIINVSSIASFLPTPGMSVYSATKSFVSTFGLGLEEELRERGIVVTSVCSGPMDTEFLDTGRIYGNSQTFENLPYCDPVRVAEKSLFAARKGRSSFTPMLPYKLLRVAAKLLPHSLITRFAKV